MTAFIGRRELVGLLGGAAAAWPIKAPAQQSAMPVVGFLDGRAATTTADRLRGFQRGLKESGYAEGDNVVILYRLRVKRSGCPNSRPNWCAGKSPSSPQPAARLRR
jgi:hypothetical protein